MRPGLTKNEVKELKKAFDLIDTDGSGRICPEELEDAMKTLRFEEENWRIYNMVCALDADGSKAIDFPKFLNMIPSSDVYEYTASFKPLQLISPNYLLAGRPFGKLYDI